MESTERNNGVFCFATAVILSLIVSCRGFPPDTTIFPYRGWELAPCFCDDMNVHFFINNNTNTEKRDLQFRIRAPYPTNTDYECVYCDRVQTNRYLDQNIHDYVNYTDFVGFGNACGFSPYMNNVFYNESLVTEFAEYYKIYPKEEDNEDHRGFLYFYCPPKYPRYNLDSVDDNIFGNCICRCKRDYNWDRESGKWSSKVPNNCFKDPCRTLVLDPENPSNIHTKMDFGCLPEQKCERPGSLYPFPNGNSSQENEHIITNRCVNCGQSDTNLQCQLQYVHRDIIIDFPSEVTVHENARFKIRLVGTNPDFLIMVGMNYGNVRFDLTLDNFEDTEGEMIFDFEHRYRSIGEDKIAYVVINGGTMTNSSLWLVKVKPSPVCLPTVFLLNCARYLKDNDLPVYKRKSYFVITTSIYYEEYCDEDTSKEVDELLKFDWKMYQLSPEFPIPLRNARWLLDGITNYVPDSDQKDKFLKFKPFGIKEGLYYIEVIVYLETGGTRVETADYCFFRVENEAPSVSIIGGTDRTVPLKSVLTVEAVAHDLASEENTEHLEYTWTIKFENLNNNQLTVVRCTSLVSDNCDAPSLTVRPDAGLGTRPPTKPYMFEVKVKSDFSGLSSTATQNIHVHPDYLPIKLACVENCDKWNRGDKVLLKCSCDGCRHINVRVNQTNPSRYELQPLNGHAEFVFELEEVLSYTLVCTNAGGVKGLSQIQIDVNVPPTKGNCSIFICNKNESFAGTFLSDSFRVECDGFSTTKPENQPLTYMIYAKIENTTTFNHLPNGILLFHDVNPIAEHLELASLTLTRQAEVKVLVRVVDGKGSFVWADPINVTVNPPSFTSIWETVIGTPSKQSTIIRRIHAGDEQRALQIISGLMYSRIISVTIVQESLKQQLLKEIGLALEKIQLTSIYAVQQVTEAVYLLSQFIDRDMPFETLLASKDLQLKVVNMLDEKVDGKVEPETYPAEDVIMLSRASKEAGSNLFDEITQRGRRTLNTSALHPLVEGDQEDLEELDELKRDYFSDYADILGGNNEIEGNATLIEVIDFNLTSQDAELLAAAAQDVFEQMETIMDTASKGEVDRSDFGDESHISNVHTTVQRVKGKDLANKNLTNDKVTFKISGGIEDYLERQDITDVFVEMIETDENPFFGDLDHHITTQVAAIVLKHNGNNNSRTPIPFDESFIDVFIPLKSKTDNSMEPTNYYPNYTVPIVPYIKIDLDKAVTVHKVLIPAGSKLHVHIEVVKPKLPPNKGPYFLIVARNSTFPTKEDFCAGNDSDLAQVIHPDSTEPFEKTFAVFNIAGLNEAAEALEFDKEAGLFTYYIGIWPYYNDTFFYAVEDHEKVTYKVIFSQTSCLIRDENSNAWDDKKCEIGNQTTASVLHCRCRHLSIFAGSVFIPPNSLDIMESVDLLFGVDDNFIVIYVLGALFTLYLILFVICYLLDRQDKIDHAGLTIMTQIGEHFENAFYIITVDTGSRFFAGTSANVSIQIYGSNGRSEAYVIKDPTLPVLNRAGVDSFLISSKKDLGTLEKIRLWHDNSGTTPGWYVRKVIIQNVKSGQKWFFYIENWLSLSNEDDPSIIREIPVAGPNEPLKWSRRFKDLLVDEFTNTHVWFSIFLRYPTSNFTRCQRVGCAIAILISYMLINIMFAGFITNDFQSRLEFGVVTFNALDILLAVETTILAFPFGFLLVRLFKRTRQQFIPTLIIWKNRTKFKIDYNEAHLFIPDKQGFRKELVPIVSGIGGTADPGSDFSIPGTNIKKCEEWIADVTRGENIDIPYHLPLPAKFIRGIDEDGNTVSHADQNDLSLSTDFNRFGRFAIIDSIRRMNPSSFIWQGDNDIPHIEQLIDEEIEHYAMQEHPPWENMTEQDLRRIKDELMERKRQLAPRITPVEVVEKEAEPDENSNLSESEDKDDSRKEKPFPTSKKYTGIALDLYEMPPVHKEVCYFPWWFIYVAWTLCLLVIFMCAVVILLYGMRYGRLRSLQWVYRIAIAWVQSILFVQPLTIFFVAFIFSILFKRVAFPEEDRFQVLFKEDGEYIGEPKPLKMHVFNPVQSYPPLTGIETFNLRIKARRRNALKRSLISIVFHIILMAFLFFIANARHSSDEYLIHDHMHKMLEINDLKFCPGCVNELEAVRDESSFYFYMEHVLLPAINPIQRYDGTRLPAVAKNEPTIMKDEVTMLVGVARIRQLRIKTHECQIPRSLKILIAGQKSVDDKSSTSKLEPIICTPNYHTELSDTKTYDSLWIIPTTRNRTFKSTNDMWAYRTSSQTLSLSRIGVFGYYDGGGYVAELGKDFRRSYSVLHYLNRANWIDYKTRAVFVEFVAYSPNLNLFVDVVLMFERSPSTAFRASASITPIQLSSSNEDRDYSLWLQVCYACVVFLDIILYALFFRDLVYNWRHFKWSLFKRFWLWADFVIVAVCSASLGVAVYTVFFFNEIRIRLQNSLVNEYVSFQQVALWNFIHTCMFALTLCLCMVKFWKLLVLSFKRFFIMALTLRLTSRLLIAYIFALGLLTVAFAMFGNMVFGQRVIHFHSFGHAFMELIHQLLSVNFYRELHDAHPVFGPLYYFFFGFLVCIISLNIFIALLNQGLMEAKEVAVQRRHWLTYWTYIKKWYFNFFPPPRKISPPEKFTIPPKRLIRMKARTREFILACLEETQIKRMNEIRRFVEQRLKNTEYTVISKVEKWRRLKYKMNSALVPERRMEEMRVLILRYLKQKMHVNFTGEDYKKYAKFNMSVLQLKVRKVNQLVDQIIVEAEQYREIKDKNERTKQAIKAAEQVVVAVRTSTGKEEPPRRRSMYEHLLEQNEGNEPEARERRIASFFDISDPETWAPGASGPPNTRKSK